MNKTASIIIIFALIIVLTIIFYSDSGKPYVPGQNIEVRDGVQYITIDAKAGYFPAVSTAKSGIPTKLIMKTDGTYDCSAALVIKSIGYEKILPQNGVTEIDLGVGDGGETLQGVCGMGMYSFKVEFQQ